MSRHAAADVNVVAIPTDSVIAYTALTASRVVTLCPASAYPTGQILWIVDESGACSATSNIIVNRTNADLIDGALSQVLTGAFATLALESNGVDGWGIAAPNARATFAALGVGTPADPGNPFSVKANAASFNALSVAAGGSGDFRAVLNKATAANTASLLLQDGFSNRAEIGLKGDDSLRVTLSPDGATFVDAVVFDAASGAAVFANMRTQVMDAPYAVLRTDRLVAYVSLSAPRTVRLPAASAFPAGVPLTVVDESGGASPINIINVYAAPTELIDGRAFAAIASGFGSLTLVSNGFNKWTIIASRSAVAASAYAYNPGTIGNIVFNNTSDANVQKFLAALTGNVTVGYTLNGAVNGMSKRTISPPNLGGFTFKVQGRAMSVNQWIDHIFDGTAWQETAAGSL